MLNTKTPRTVDAAADELGLSPHTLRSWISRRLIGHVRLGRAIRIPAAEIERLLEEGTVPPRRVRR
jgi:excisionase family DNA binding protein